MMLGLQQVKDQKKKKMGSDVSPFKFKALSIVRDKVTRQCPQTPQLLERERERERGGELKQNQT